MSRAAKKLHDAIEEIEVCQQQGVTCAQLGNFQLAGTLLKEAIAALGAEAGDGKARDMALASVGQMRAAYRCERAAKFCGHLVAAHQLATKARALLADQPIHAAQSCTAC